MLGRRQIREKVVENLYAYYQNPIKLDVLEKNMFSEIDKVYHLYVLQLNFLVALKNIASQQVEIKRNKFLKSDEDANPNLRFIENKPLEMLEDNTERLSFTSKHQELKWDLHDELLVKTFQKIVNGKRYQDYMALPSANFEEDQKFLGKLFLRYIAENDDFHNYIEEREMSWADDFHISNSMVQKTIGFLKNGEPSTTLIKTLKDEEDRDFASKLLRSAVNGVEENEKKIDERLQNWDMERVSVMDKVILLAAIAEMDAFPFTASRIIINEYVEISKIYASEKSNIFVNGILDKYSKDNNRI